MPQCSPPWSLTPSQLCPLVIFCMVTSLQTKLSYGIASIRPSDRRTPLPSTMVLQWKFFACIYYDRYDFDIAAEKSLRPQWQMLWWTSYMIFCCHRHIMMLQYKFKLTIGIAIVILRLFHVDMWSLQWSFSVCLEMWGDVATIILKY